LARTLSRPREVSSPGRRNKALRDKKEGRVDLTCPSFFGLFSGGSDEPLHPHGYAVGVIITIKAIY